MNSLEALQELFIRAGGGIDNKEYTTSRCREIIAEDLKVLEIIRKKRVDVNLVVYLYENKKGLKPYNYWINKDSEKLTYKEFKLLGRLLK